MIRRRKPDSPPKAVGEARRPIRTNVEHPEVVTVRICIPDRGLADGLARDLGPTFNVSIGTPIDGAINVVSVAGPVDFDSLRREHPRASLMLIDLHRAMPDDAVAECLTAGADGYLFRPSPTLLAAHLKAVHRRRR